jgi:hypothetical protein
MPRKTDNRAKNWTFTSFGDEEPLFNDATMQYMVYQREQCPDTGRLHWQGYVQMKKTCRFGGAKEALPTGAHIEKARGSPKDNKDYCTKDESRVPGTEPTEHGSLMTAGKRNDLIAVAAAISMGKPMHEVAQEYPAEYIKYSTGMQRFRDLMVNGKPRTMKTDVIVLTGPTGCGKSKWAHETFPDAYTKPPTKWWDGYEGQDVVILDEFYGQLSFSYMLKLMDRYPLRVEVKGGVIHFRAKLLIITSNKPWNEFYDLEHDWKPAFLRRLNEVYSYEGTIADGQWRKMSHNGDPYNLTWENCAGPEAPAWYRANQEVIEISDDEPDEEETFLFEDAQVVPDASPPLWDPTVGGDFDPELAQFYAIEDLDD